MSPAPPDFVAIRLDAPETECIACGIDGIRKLGGIPMCEGRVLAVDEEGEWGGFDACADCLQACNEGGPAALNARLRALGLRELK